MLRAGAAIILGVLAIPIAFLSANPLALSIVRWLRREQFAPRQMARDQCLAAGGPAVPIPPMGSPPLTTEDGSPVADVIRNMPCPESVGSWDDPFFFQGREAIGYTLFLMGAAALWWLAWAWFKGKEKQGGRGVSWLSPASLLAVLFVAIAALSLYHGVTSRLA